MAESGRVSARAADDAVGVRRLDLALDGDHGFRMRRVHVVAVRDVAEAVDKRSEVAMSRAHAPAVDAQSLIGARAQPQHLRRGRNRLLVMVSGLMSNGKAHRFR
jgi:hypothetical protein